MISKLSDLYGNNLMDLTPLRYYISNIRTGLRTCSITPLSDMTDPFINDFEKISVISGKYNPISNRRFELDVWNSLSSYNILKGRDLK